MLSSKTSGVKALLDQDHDNCKQKMAFSHIWEVLQKKNEINISANNVGLSVLGNRSWYAWGLSIVLIALKLIKFLKEPQKQLSITVLGICYTRPLL